MSSLLATATLLFALSNVGLGAAWFDSPPSPLYPSSGKRHHLPYHPVARFRGADSRSYYPYEAPYFPEYTSQNSNPVSNNVVPDGKLNAGELLALLFSELKEGQPSSRMRGTLRFGIARR